MSRRRAFGVLVILFAVLAVCWVFYLPYAPRRLYRAIPPQADLVTEHEDLASRWREIAGNPFVRNALILGGVSAQAIDTVLADPLVDRVLPWVASRKTVVARVPTSDARPAAWVVATWIGGRSHVLKAAFGLGLVPGFEAVRTLGGTVWVNREALDSEGRQLGVALAEGVAVAVIGNDPAQVGLLRKRVRKGAAVTPLLLRGVGTGAETEQAPDRAWIAHYRPGPFGTEPLDLRVGLDRAATNSLAGWVRTGADLALPVSGTGARLSVGQGLDNLARLLGDRPHAVSVASFGAMLPLLERAGPSAALDILVRALREIGDEEGCVFLSMLGGKDSGRVLGLKVPSFLVGVEVREGADVIGPVKAALDRLNAVEEWGLIPRLKEVAGYPVMIADSSRFGLYASLGVTENPALAVAEGWMMFSSTENALTRVLESLGKTGPDAGPARWLADVRQADSGALWVDLEASEQDVRNAVAVYSLMLTVQRHSQRDEIRAAMEEAKAWLAAARPLRTAMVQLERGPSSGPVLKFRLGPERP